MGSFFRGFSGVSMPSESFPTIKGNFKGPTPPIPAKANNTLSANWFKPWPFYPPIVGGHLASPLISGHVLTHHTKKVTNSQNCQDFDDYPVGCFILGIILPSYMGDCVYICKIGWLKCQWWLITPWNKAYTSNKAWQTSNITQPIIFQVSQRHVFSMRIRCHDSNFKAVFYWLNAVRKINPRKKRGGGGRIRLNLFLGAFGSSTNLLRSTFSVFFFCKKKQPVVSPPETKPGSF